VWPRARRQLERRDDDLLDVFIERRIELQHSPLR